jgi:cell fate (sporulation/competence/biofilm development) regulator YlbF (YheA/YmcA/DUF963 family)
MNTTQAARALGKEIQADARYIAYMTARQRNDEDAELQALIGEFNLLRQQLQREMSKPDGERDEDKKIQLNKAVQQQYTAVMTNENMAFFTAAKREMDRMISEINQIVSLCCDGEDPDTVDPTQFAPGCSGSCDSCAGCD